MRQAVEPKLEGPRFTLAMNDGTWVSLAQLRSLVAEADRLGWSDNSLLSARVGEHPSRHDVRLVRALVLEGGPS